MNKGPRLPKFHETFIPILDILSHGNPIHHRDVRKKVREKYYSDLPEDLLSEKVKTGDNKLFNRIGWGISSMKIGKFAKYPERGYVQITEKGLRQLEKGTLTLKEFRNDPDHIEHKKALEAKKTVKENYETGNPEDESPQDLIDRGFSEIESQVQADLLERLKNIDPYYFEKVILILLKKMGYGDFLETPKSGDGGIDGVINQDQLGVEKIYIQAKRYTDTKVRETDIRNFIGAMSGDTDKGVFVTTSTFDEKALQKAKEAHHTIILIDGLELVTLMHKFGVGVQVKNIYELKEIDEDFFEGE